MDAQIGHFRARAHVMQMYKSLSAPEPHLMFLMERCSRSQNIYPKKGKEWFRSHALWQGERLRASRITSDLFSTSWHDLLPPLVALVGRSDMCECGRNLLEVGLQQQKSHNSQNENEPQKNLSSFVTTDNDQFGLKRNLHLN